MKGSNLYALIHIFQSCLVGLCRADSDLMFDTTALRL